MKKIEVVKADEVEIKPFTLDKFTQDKANNRSIKKVTKKELKKLAKELGLTFGDKQIVFAKKLIIAYLGKK